MLKTYAGPTSIEADPSTSMLYLVQNHRLS